jgi:hypothetical protein
VPARIVLLLGRMARSPRAAFVGASDARLVQVLCEALFDIGVTVSTPEDADLVLTILDGSRGAQAAARVGAGSVPVLAVVLPFATQGGTQTTAGASATWFLGEPLARFRELALQLLAPRH